MKLRNPPLCRHSIWNRKTWVYWSLWIPWEDRPENMFFPSKKKIKQKTIKMMHINKQIIITIQMTERERECSLFIFTETWLNHLVPHVNADLPGFTAVRDNRDTKRSREKQKWGTHHVYQQPLVPGHFSVKTVSRCWDFELLAVSLRP